MFHTVIRAQSGAAVDFDRASFLMDRELLQQSLDAMRVQRPAASRFDSAATAQWVWDHYCRRHAAKYDEAFVPDVNPEWDTGGIVPAQAADVELARK